MIQKSKNYAYLLIYILLQAQPLYSMEQPAQPLQQQRMSVYNPLSWVYGLCSTFHYNFVWVTKAQLEERLVQYNQECKKDVEIMVMDILDGNCSFVKKIRSDNKKIKKGYNAKIQEAENIKESAKQKMTLLFDEMDHTRRTLLIEGIKNKHALLKVIDECKKTTESIANKFDTFTSETVEEVTEINRLIPLISSDLQNRIKDLFISIAVNNKERQDHYNKTHKKSQKRYEEAQKSLQQITTNHEETKKIVSEQQQKNLKNTALLKDLIKLNKERERLKQKLMAQQKKATQAPVTLPLKTTNTPQDIELPVMSQRAQALAKTYFPAKQPITANKTNNSNSIVWDIEL